MAEKKNVRKSRVKLKDLPPRKDEKGGRGGFLSANDPLPIPPPGFFAGASPEKRDERR